ncbi:MyTH4 domain-domain-containing protein [Catenaria anguillulae PL171]|uniref:MyTH4 domain-domain-containing protein n=1 Tax=Catenaria anguillulae PL171 TaxID=765915 RepID=A0A1Y2HBG8_9FUNG|nr:MyTH4 domain-domain-containing protein [Catenaria anguillulae PL171]
MVGAPQGLSNHFGSQGTIGRQDGGTPRSRRATDSAGDAKVVTIMDVPKLATLQLGDHSMEQFASQAFETKSGTIFGKKKNAFDAKSLEYSDSPLRKPLTRAAYGDTRDVKLACDISGWILAFMGDVKTKTPLEAVKNIIDTALSSPTTLVDETYCQVVKQINQNPRPEGVQQGLRLLAICGVFLMPSSELFPAMCRFMQQLIRSNSSLADQVELAYGNMYKTSRLSPRNLGPSREELEALNANALIKFRVEMPDRTARAFLIDSFSLCSDILVKIENKYETGDFSKDYSLVLDCGPRSGAQPLLMVPILESDRLADFLTFAENLTHKRDTEKAESSATPEAKFSTKPRIEAPRIVYTRLFWSTKGAGAARAHRATEDGKAGDKDKLKTGSTGNSLPTLQQRNGFDNHLPPIPHDLPPYYSPELLEWTFAQLRTSFLNGDLFAAAEFKPNAQPEITYLMALLAIITLPTI